MYSFKNNFKFNLDPEHNFNTKNFIYPENFGLLGLFLAKQSNMKKMPPFPSSAICYDNDDCDVCDVFDFVMFLIDMLKKTKTLMDLS